MLEVSYNESFEQKVQIKHRDTGRDVLEGGGDREKQGERVQLPEDGGRAW